VTQTREASFKYLSNRRQERKKREGEGRGKRQVTREKPQIRKSRKETAARSLRKEEEREEHQA